VKKVSKYALQKRLLKAKRHSKWIEENLPNTKQQKESEREIESIRQQLTKE